MSLFEPVFAALTEHADPTIRRRWVEERALTVFSLHDPANPMREVDLFAAPPIDFDELWRRSVTMRVGGIQVHVASLDDLSAMKRLAGRPQDIADIAALDESRRGTEGAGGD